LKLANIPTLVVNAGLKVKPQVPFVELGGCPGMDIRTGKAVENVERVIDRSKILGESLSRIADYLVVGESIPGGTTTALAVLLAMGVNAKGKVSSSMPINPHELKIHTAEEGLKNSGIKEGELENDPIRAVSTVGDPMQPAVAGLVIGAAENVPVIMAGGTQMAAVLAIVNSLKKDVLTNVAIGTTRWIINDKTSNIINLISRIINVPVLAADINFSKLNYDGLKAYELGVVKEGVGCGGAAIAAVLKSNGKITKNVLLNEIKNNYKQLLN
jgi:uncharacterized protein (TIGR00303 family)